MKKLILLVSFIAVTLSMAAQDGAISVLGNLGYQTDYKRFAIGVQGRYNFTKHIRVAPDVTFFFPKNKVTGFDVNLNAHYVFDLQQDRLSFYPLVGIGMQNNHYGKQDIFNATGQKILTQDSFGATHFALNLGGGITYNLGPKSFLNAEGKYQFADENNAVFLIGYGYKF